MPLEHIGKVKFIRKGQLGRDGFDGESGSSQQDPGSFHFLVYQILVRCDLISLTKDPVDLGL